MKHGEQRDPRPFGCFSAGSAAFGLRLFALTLVFSLAALSHASLQSLVSRPADSRVTPAEAMPREATQAKSPSPSRSVPVLASSARPPVPNDLSVLWLVPAPEEMERLPNALTRFAEGVRLYLDGKIDQALPLVSAPALQATPLADYATYYRGLVLVGLGRVEEARQVFASVSERSPQGYLGEAAPLREAETADAVGDVKSALRVYEKLAGMKTARPDDIWMRMGGGRVETRNGGELDECSRLKLAELRWGPAGASTSLRRSLCLRESGARASGLGGLTAGDFARSGPQGDDRRPVGWGLDLKTGVARGTTISILRPARRGVTKFGIGVGGATSNGQAAWVT